ncbi:hypothetical protein AHF37_08819 [Paragonimus kellicotti]|nr:hypothetical protein AHF37_08819 [Paragonimus kellicotti]
MNCTSLISGWFTGRGTIMDRNSQIIMMTVSKVKLTRMMDRDTTNVSSTGKGHNIPRCMKPV